MTTRLYSVPAISCEHCKNSIEGEVGRVPGVAQVNVDVAARTVRVAGEATDEAIREAISEAGYEVEGNAAAS
jgi:copper ion binding protein